MAKQPASAPQDKAATGSRPVARAKSSGSGGRATTGDAVSRRVGSPSLGAFFRDSRAELSKVTWPTWQEATNLTLAVIGMTLAIAVFLGVVDSALDFVVKHII